MAVDITIIIPAYNEEATIANVVSRTIKSISYKFPFLSYEILVIDDGSTDQTFEVIKKLNVTVLKNKCNMGKGYSLRKGFVASRGKIIVTIDADGSHFPEDLPSIINPILKNEADLVIGSRFKNKQTKFTTSLNLFGNMLFNVLFLILTKKKITDTQSGFRASKKYLLQSLNIKSTRYDIESEILMKVAMKNYRIKEVPIKSITRLYDETNLHSFKDGLKILLCMGNIYRKYLK